MSRALGALRVVAASAVLVGGLTSCPAPELDGDQLLEATAAFELAIRDQPRETVRKLLRTQAREYGGRVVRVVSGVVASPYSRENESHVYFGVGYDPAEHLFLSEIDPPLHEALAHHRLWASVVVTSASRQLSFELPVDELTFPELEPGRRIAFSCRIAALIRGRSVYCAPDGLELTLGAGPME